MQTFLERLDRLEAAEERTATREADHAALATLAGRGLDAAERARLKELVRIAEAGATPDEPGSPDTAQADLAALWGWLRDWMETARTVVTRRDHRIQLGLSRRRRNKKDEAAAAVVPPQGVVVQPAALPAAIPAPAMPAPVPAAAPSSA